MSKAFEQLPAVIVGRLGAIAGAAAMRADGASVISLCRIDDGGAPMLEQGTTRRDALVLPDLQIFNWKHAPGCRFVEIKTYERAAENRRHSCWVHGIPVRLFNHYVANEQATGVPVHLAINELDTGELRISDVPISELTRLECQCRGHCVSLDAAQHVPSKTGIREMQWYFDREDFPIVYKHSDKTISEIRDAHSRQIRRNHAWQRHGVDRTSVAAPSGCQRCGGTTECMHVVGPLDQPGYRMCSTCWRAGYPTGPTTGPAT